MTRRILTILLMISLAFNLAVLGVFIFTVATGRPPFPPPHHDRRMMDGKRDGKKPGQKQWMMDCMKEGMQGCQPVRDSFQVDRKQFIQILKAANFNEAAARTALEKSLQTHSHMEKTLGENLISMRKKMTAREASLFFDRRFERKVDDRNNFEHQKRKEHRRSQ